MEPPSIPEACAQSFENYFLWSSPTLRWPYWLKPLNDLWPQIDLACANKREPVKALVSVPSQHGKSTEVNRGLAWIIGRHPRLHNGLFSYGADLAHKLSRRTRTLARDAGVEMGEREAAEEWETAEGGGLIATGVGGPVTGNPLSGVAIIDDLYKGWKFAHSPTIRANAEDWYRTDYGTRVHPQTSELIVATRWHQKGLPQWIIDNEGRVEDGGKWIVINLSSPTPTGEALWEEGRPLTFIMAQRKKLGPRRAAAIYDGKPHEQAGVVFGAPVTCAMAEVPTRGRYGHGVDFAYTAKTSADFSIWLEMLRVDTGDRMEDGSPDPLFYIANVAREQMRAEDFAPILRAKAKLRPGTPMEWHTSTTEKGTAGILAAFVGVPIKAVPADADKLIRSLDIATVWNRGRVITPYDAPWSEEFLRVVTNFTGAGGNETDDDVDAMVSAHGTLKGSGGKVTTGGKRLTSMGAWDAL